MQISAQTLKASHEEKMTMERMQVLFRALWRVEEYEGLASLFQRSLETSYIKQGGCGIARDRLDFGLAH